ncbi:hypothetical protein DIPPA_30377, partial [Diplonema papillatum]
ASERAGFLRGRAQLARLMTEVNCPALSEDVPQIILESVHDLFSSNKADDCPKLWNCFFGLLKQLYTTHRKVHPSIGIDIFGVCAACVPKEHHEEDSSPDVFHLVTVLVQLLSPSLSFPSHAAAAIALINAQDAKQNVESVIQDLSLQSTEEPSLAVASILLNSPDDETAYRRIKEKYPRPDEISLGEILSAVYAREWIEGGGEERTYDDWEKHRRDKQKAVVKKLCLFYTRDNVTQPLIDESRMFVSLAARRGALHKERAAQLAISVLRFLSTQKGVLFESEEVVESAIADIAQGGQTPYLPPPRS